MRVEEKPCADVRITQRFLHIESRSDAERLQGAAGKAHEGLRRLAPVQLYDVEARDVGGSGDLVPTRVDEDPHARHERRQSPPYVAGSLQVTARGLLAQKTRPIASAPASATAAA